MDLRAYYEKVRAAAGTIAGVDAVMVSVATPEGGKAGVKTEVPREIAARLMADGRARVATDEEAEEFHNVNVLAKAKHEQDEAARRIQVMVIPSHGLDSRPKARN